MFVLHLEDYPCDLKISEISLNYKEKKQKEDIFTNLNTLKIQSYVIKVTH